MALIGSKDKKYGLILKGKAAGKQQAAAGGSASASAGPRPSVFGDESDEDDREFEAKFKSFDSRRETMKAQMKKQTQVSLETVLAEDPSAFEYDTLYDAMHAERERKAEQRRDPVDRKPKYMAKLLKTAHERKLERELQNDRRVQKELEAEGDQFKDKERFVTGAYKRKMEELRALEDRRRQEALVEDAFDVTKQDGLAGFYRFMLHNRDSETSGTPEAPDEVKKAEETPAQSREAKEEPPEPRERQRRSSPRPEDRSRRRRSRSPPRRAEERREDAGKAKEKAEASAKAERVRQRAEEARAKFARRTDETAAEDARARFLARRQQRARAAPVEPDSD